MDRFADRADRLGEILHPVGMGHIARLEMDFRHPQVIPADEAVEDFRQEPALLAPQAAHDAEVDGDDAAFIVNEEIALMHVGVKEAVAERGAQESLNQDARERGKVESELGQPLPVGQRDPVDPFHRHHFARGAAPVDRGRAEIWIILGVFDEFRRPRRFEPKIHLHPHRAGERLDDLGGRRRRKSDASLSASRAAKNMSARSRANRRSVPARSTFTATGRTPSSVFTSAR